MRRAIASICLSGTLEDKLEAIAAAGFDAVQIYDTDLLYYDGTPAQARALAADLGVALDAYLPLRDIEGLDEAGFAKCLARAEHRLDAAAELGVPLVLVTASTLAAASADPARAAAQLRVLADKAAARNLKLAYGALAWAAHVKTLAQAWEIVSAADHPNLDVFVSSFQQLATGSPQPLPEIPGARIAALQIADASNIALDPVAKSRFYSGFPGQGDLDIAGLTGAVLARGYKGSLALEVHNDAFRGASTRSIAEDGMRGLLLLEEKLQHSTPKPPVPLFDPPPPARALGIQFLEFAATGAAADELGTWFESLGFEKLGRHRSKNVFLYRAGAVNLVLNAEPESFGQSYFLMHGPSVCALGIRTDDDARAMARAMAFHATKFEGRIGPNELEIPAVRALDGSLIYFIDAKDAEHLYEIDFLVDRRSDPDSLKTVDHLAFAVPPGQMDSWVLFYRAVLGFEAGATLVLPDPNGLVNSRAMTSKDHAVRVPLNVSQGQRTATARQVDAQAGAGVHHVAFSCADIFATVARLRASGARLLDIPAHYYQELAFRFDLAPDFVARLEAAHILYDRIGDGEFLHVYSEPYQNRFFFEFVERRGGYDQYGAANTPFRMAAFARLQRARDRQLFL